MKSKCTRVYYMTAAYSWLGLTCLTLFYIHLQCATHTVCCMVVRGDRTHFWRVLATNFHCQCPANGVTKHLNTHTDSCTHAAG